MELTHSFTVPGPAKETWSRFQDIADLAECFPGAQVTSVEGDTFQGTVKVKLGPIALVYAGSGTFVSKDDAAHTFVVEAKGRDKRGNGTAGATVTLSMSGSTGDGGPSTDVSVRTDLSITGKPAQFGRGVMQDVSDKLLGQFVACLQERSSAPAEEPVADQDAGPSSAPPPEPSERSEPVAPPTPAPSPAATTGRPSPTGAGADDALDLGATVLPVLARAYWRQAAAALVAVLLAWRVLRRHR
ncbi:Carbon monoxide dehydrogenase subunit G [Nocardioides terrae]|uniref:Carbon monoxide dehydrogenase subunit G n=1 Tax=Nocardioides terrae TaxID=574651 RepID=A0A1I1N585_9ACTN|nr:SRPBCC family protein [Nocardioides terrae]SFC88920.1 Carbon monoxide dehydrogenase subunit G [Nocardioides terrae]